MIVQHVKICLVRENYMLFFQQKLDPFCSIKFTPMYQALSLVTTAALGIVHVKGLQMVRISLNFCFNMTVCFMVFSFSLPLFNGTNFSCDWKK